MGAIEIQIDRVNNFNLRPAVLMIMAKQHCLWTLSLLILSKIFYFPPRLGVTRVSETHHLGYAGKFLFWPLSLWMFEARHWVLCHWCLLSFWGQRIYEGSRRGNQKNSSDWLRRGCSFGFGPFGLKKKGSMETKVDAHQRDYSTKKPSSRIFYFCGFVWMSFFLIFGFLL